MLINCWHFHLISYSVSVWTVYHCVSRFDQMKEQEIIANAHNHFVRTEITLKQVSFFNAYIRFLVQFRNFILYVVVWSRRATKTTNCFNENIFFCSQKYSESLGIRCCFFFLVKKINRKFYPLRTSELHVMRDHFCWGVHNCILHFCYLTR